MEQSRKKLGVKKTLSMIGPYAGSRILEQLKAVLLIGAYLILFQVLILGQPLQNALAIGIGIAAVVFGLAFFMEGLLIGLMPLGEQLGTKLPAKANILVILIFGLILGFGATLAEPALSALKFAGSSVKAWESPTLFYLLNSGSNYLVIAVGIGVGIAVLVGMLRFMFGWSLKPFILIVVPILLILTVIANTNPALKSVIGLAWDTGGITTGPVTVPLVLALGIGISRMSKKGSGMGGFGVVTMASALPVLTVMILAMVVSPNLPKPTTEAEFFKSDKKSLAMVFGSEKAIEGYLFLNASQDTMSTFYEKTSSDNRVSELAGPALPSFPELKSPGEKASAEQIKLYQDSVSIWEQYRQELPVAKQKRIEVFGGTGDDFYYWLETRAQKYVRDHLILSGAVSEETLAKIKAEKTQSLSPDLLPRNAIGAAQSIIPLAAFLILVFFIIARTKLPRFDEVLLGILFSIFGMAIFNIGIELGLSNIGNQVGGNVPALYRGIAQNAEVKINNFDPSMVEQSIDKEGKSKYFFYYNDGTGIKTVPYEDKNLDAIHGVYTYKPQLGPVASNFVAGTILTLLFAFILGFAATLAEPALNALGRTVEELTVGTFKKSLLMNAVAIGVGIGIAVGVLKLLFNIELIWLIGPPYLLLLFLTIVSNEDFVNIGWDSAGVTTGPVTVPLVLAMGLGIGSQMGVIEGFGILAAASVYPILSVLIVGLIVQGRRQRMSVTNEGIQS